MTKLNFNSERLVLKVIMALSCLAALPRLLPSPLGRWAGWRESLTHMMALNLAEGNGNLWLARVDHFDPLQTAYAAEFPWYGAVVAGLMNLFGHSIFWGRTVSFAMALVGLYCFYELLLLLVKDKRWAVLSTVAFSLSNWLIIGTICMPDVTACTMVLGGTLIVSKYLLNTVGRAQLVFGIVLITIGGLTKLPALVILAFLVPLMLQFYGLRPNASILSRVVLVTLLIGVATLPSLYYFLVWHPIAVEEGAFALTYPTKFLVGLREVFVVYGNNSIDMLLYRGWGGYTMSVLGMLGLLYASLEAFRKRSSPWLTYSVPLLITVYGIGILLLAGKTGVTFATHPYYALPFLPLAAVGVGFLLSRKQVPTSFCILVLLVGLGEQTARTYREDKQARGIARLAEAFEAAKHPRGPLISGFGFNPVPSYYFQRRTWGWQPHQVENEELFRAARKEGAVGVIVPVGCCTSIQKGGRLFAENETAQLYVFD